jgi:hypothetical protein
LEIFFGRLSFTVINLICLEADLPLWSFISRDHLLNRLDDQSNFNIMLVDFLPEFLEQISEVFVGSEDFSQFDERAHDQNVDFDGALTFQDGGEHGNPLLGKSMGKIFGMLAFLYDSKLES